MKKRFPAMILALVLWVGLAVLPVRAQPAERGSAVLSGASLEVYHQLKQEIAKVAGGGRGSTEIQIDTAGMGISYAAGGLRGLDVTAVMNALMADCPYELYWFDKMRGGYAASYQYSSGSGAVSSVTFRLAVSQDYAVIDSGGKSYYMYQADTGKTSAAAAAAKNAQAVVERSSGLSDYDKLAAYRDYICEQASYNFAAGGSESYPYGDPWQLIYVFDNDPDTNVVCEGYAKAFKYLCDLTTFSGRVECYAVSGTTSGRHMWNLVRINGQSYLVDMTNSDTGAIGEYGGLFLAGTPNATEAGYTISLPRHDLDDGRYIPARSISYSYDPDMKALYGGILTLASSGYDPAAAPPPADTPPADDPPASTPKFTDVPDWCAAAVNWAVDEKITQGVGNNRFAPGKDCTHVEILTFLWRAEDKPGSTATVFSGLAGDYAPAANWAYEQKLIDGSFDPGALCTRAQAVSYIWQVFKSQKAGASDFSDVDAGADYAAAVNWAVENGIVEGYSDGTFRPNNVCNRGAIVTMLRRAYVEEARLK